MPKPNHLFRGGHLFLNIYMYISEVADVGKTHQKGRIIAKGALMPQPSCQAGKLRDVEGETGYLLLT